MSSSCSRTSRALTPSELPPGSGTELVHIKIHCQEIFLRLIGERGPVGRAHDPEVAVEGEVIGEAEYLRLGPAVAVVPRGEIRHLANVMAEPAGGGEIIWNLGRRRGRWVGLQMVITRGQQSVLFHGVDMDTWVGNLSWSCIQMAVHDFYAAHPAYTTRLILHSRNSKQDVVSSASSALDLLKNVGVQAILGPQTSIQAKFIAELGNKSQTPIISFSATSPFLSSPRIPYFIRTALSDSTQAKAIASLVHSFGWNQLIPIFEDTDYGTGMIPYLVDAFQAADARVPYRSMIPLTASNDQILRELYNLKTMQTRVFVVHASNSLASRVLLKAREADMMREGYAWVITYGLADELSFMDSSTVNAMHGILTVKPYVTGSSRYENFSSRWKEWFRNQNDKPSVFALWAYDTTWALALAAESIGSPNPSTKGRMPSSAEGIHPTDLERLRSRPSGQRLLDSILSTSFNGLTGEFRLVNGQLQSTPELEIINVVAGKKKLVGFWTEMHGISGRLDSRASLHRVVWPGDSLAVPKGLEWEMLTGKKLRIGVPVKLAFPEFVNREWNPLTNRNGSGFCIEVFDTVMISLPYNVPYEYIPFEDRNGNMKGTYNDLVYQVYLQNFDVVVGDVTITRNRSLYVDFSVPFTEQGMSIVVPVRDDRRKDAWIFLEPLTAGLWMGIGAAFIFTGFVVWVIEHRSNDSFRGPPLHQVGTILYFSFSTLVFAHREKVVSNFTRVVMIIWLFVVLILTSSYTASLTSILTVQQLHPTFTDINDLIRNGEYFGCLSGSSMPGLLNIIDKPKLRFYGSAEEYDEARTKGSSRGGVGAIIEEIPYIKVFLSKYCGKYTMIGNIYRTEGFGFVFPKGSPLVPDISRTILKVTDGIERKLYRNKTACPDQSYGGASDSLTFDCFSGLFLITGIASTSALALFLISFFFEHRQVLHQSCSEATSIWQRLAAIAKLFDQKGNPSRAEDADGGAYTTDSLSKSPSSFSTHPHGNSGTDDEETPAQSPSNCHRLQGEESVDTLTEQV